MTETPQELIARLRFAAMDTLNRDKVRSEAREAADWMAAALVREARLRDALVVITQAKTTTNSAVNVQTIWNVTARARAAMELQP